MTTTLISYIVLSLCIASLLFAEAWATSRKSRSFSDIISGQGHLAVLNSKHLSGIVVFTIGCWYYSSSLDSNIQIFELPWNDEWLLTCFAIAVTTVVIGFRAAKNNPVDPHHSSLSSFLLAVYLLIRIIFLILYECFFRGVLLLTLINEIEVIPAILINISLYVLIHCYSNRREIIGCIPFGFLLCMITLFYFSIWPAIIVHLALAISHEIRLVSNKQSFFKSQKL